VVSLAKENLLHEKSKIALSIGGVTLGVLLIFTTVGLYNGINTVVENMVLKGGADLWITSRGSSGSLHSPSLLPAGLENALDIDGVREVAPLIRIPVATDLGRGKTLVYVNGYDTESGLGGPWKVTEGASTPGAGEMIVDRVLAERNGIGIGDELTIEERSFRVVGISDETFIMIASLVFVTLEDARAFLPADLTNFYLVSVDSPSRIADVAQTMEEALPGISVSTSETNAAEAKDETVGGFLPVILVLSAIGVLVGVLVVGLLVYTLTIEKSREYGIVKAVGASNLYLYRIVLAQAVVVAVLGFVTGAALSVPAISLMRRLVPEFVVIITPEMVLWVFLVFLVTGALASLVPVRRLSRIDPAMVFKER
jgi:putative ABC transport system permease protein